MDSGIAAGDAAHDSPSQGMVQHAHPHRTARRHRSPPAADPKSPACPSLLKQTIQDQTSQHARAAQAWRVRLTPRLQFCPAPRLRLPASWPLAAILLRSRESGPFATEQKKTRVPQKETRVPYSHFRNSLQQSESYFAVFAFSSLSTLPISISVTPVSTNAGTGEFTSRPISPESDCGLCWCSSARPCNPSIAMV